MTFEERRKELLRRVIESSEGKVYSRPAIFLNNDVPEFLKELDEFERKSRETVLVVK